MNEFLEWFTNLSEKDLERFDQFYTEDAYFKDPFQAVTGRDLVKKIFIHMFESPLTDHKFTFIDKIIEGEKMFVTWDYTFKFKGQEYKVHGSSHLKFKDGKCQYHRDYWDTGEEVFAKIPVLKSIHRFVVKKFQVIKD